MAAIAEGYMDIDEATIKNKKYETHKEGAEALNREIIQIWRNKNPDNQVKVSYIQSLLISDHNAHVEPLGGF